MVKITKEFVVVLVSLLVVSLIGTVLSLVFDFYSSWMGWLFLGFFIILMGLVVWKKFIKEAKKDVKVASKFVKKEEKEYPRLFKVLHFLILLIPVVILGYLIYVNFVPSQEFNYFYDVGSDLDTGKPYLSPLNRISDVFIADNITFRNLTSQLVYFSVPIPRGSDSVDVQLRFSNNFPEASSLLLGGQNKLEWSYLSKAVYNPILNELSEYNYTESEHRIYRINSQMPLVENISEIPRGSIVAENIGLIPVVNNQSYELKNLTISSGLRDAHTFYLYLNNSLDLTVKKQDINWYNGSDELNISLLDINQNLIANVTIEDDGVIVVNKNPAKIQEGSFRVANLSSGVYILKFSSYDGIIREIKLNTHKIVTNRLFLADSNVYVNGSEKKSSVFARASRDDTFRFNTYHKQGIQDITINKNKFSIQNYSQELFYNVKPGDYELNIYENDLIVSSYSYLSFSKDSYFEPFYFSFVTIPTNKSQLNKIDYLITDYALVESANNWFVGNAHFELKDLYINNGKLSMLINVPHLAKEELKNNSISIDWINVTVQKNGIF